MQQTKKLYKMQLENKEIITLNGIYILKLKIMFYQRPYRNIGYYSIVHIGWLHAIYLVGLGSML